MVKNRSVVAAMAAIASLTFGVAAQAETQAPAAAASKSPALVTGSNKFLYVMSVGAPMSKKKKAQVAQLAGGAAANVPTYTNFIVPGLVSAGVGAAAGAVAGTVAGKNAS